MLISIKLGSYETLLHRGVQRRQVVLGFSLDENQQDYQMSKEKKEHQRNFKKQENPLTGSQRYKATRNSSISISPDPSVSHNLK